ncbi:MAG: radical SAM protein, partial [Bryobacteraceae bacterium]
ADVRREYLTGKSCAPRCTVACVHQISYVDGWRAPQTFDSAGMPQTGDRLVQIR